MRNKRITYTKTIRLLAVLALGLLAGACTRQELEGPDGGEAMVRLTITAPGASLPRTVTRAAEADPEYLISDVRLLIFRQAGNGYRFEYMADGQQVRPDENNPQKTTFSAKLKTSDEPFKLLLVANAAEVFAGYTPMVGTDEEQVRRAIAPALRTDYPSGMPMYGEKLLPGLDARQVNTLSVTMLRAVARVDVEVDLDRELSRSFEIESVHIFRAKERLQAAPEVSALAQSERLLVTAPSVPAGAGTAASYYREREAPIDNYIQKLYLPESPGYSDASQRQSEATCVVVGGYYNGEATPTYYRADFDSGLPGHPFGQVLRNHRYQFRIRQVTGRGWETPEEAANNRATTLVAEIQAWEDFTTEMYANGDNYLGIESRDAVLKYKAGSEKTLYVQATVPYRVSWKGQGQTTQTGGPAIANEYFTAQVEACPELGDDVSRIVFTALQENRTAANFVSEMTVEWGQWIFTITVTQLRYEANIRRSIRVLSAYTGTSGNLGTSLGNGDGAAMRKILSNQANFSPEGTVDYFAGFDFTVAPTQSVFATANGTNAATHQMYTLLYGCDVFYLANENNISAYAAGAVMEWLEESPNRVLIVGADSPVTSTNLIRGDLGGPLAGDIDWWYNVAHGGSYQVALSKATSFQTVQPGAANRAFTVDGPFGAVTGGTNVTIADGYYGYARSYREEVIPLLVLNNNTDYLAIGVDPARRIVYHGDASLYQAGRLPDTGVIGTNMHARMWGNIWAWVAHQVVWGYDKDPLAEP